MKFGFQRRRLKKTRETRAHARARSARLWETGLLQSGPAQEEGRLGSPARQVGPGSRGDGRGRGCADVWAAGLPPQRGGPAPRGSRAHGPEAFGSGWFAALGLERSPKRLEKARSTATGTAALMASA